MPGTSREIERAELTGANDAFYRAFATADMAAMRSLWAREVAVFCCHPGWPPILDLGQILASWAEILSHGPQPDLMFVPQQTAIYDGVGIVCGIEILGDAQFAGTNIFVREEAGWRLAHHHAGPLAPGTFVNPAHIADPGRNARH